MQKQTVVNNIAKLLRIRLTTKIEADFLLQFQSSMFWKKKKLSSLGNFLS